MNEHLSLATVLVLTPLRPGLLAGADQTVEVLVRLQAPAAPAAAAARPPQAIALAIDRSGSMGGRPLAEARRCAEYVIGKLRPVDRVALVQFDNRVDCLHPALPLGDGADLRAALARIVEGGATNLHGGWHAAAEALDALPGGGLRRVILLSDGQANDGLVEPAAITAQCGALAARGVTTSSYGLGLHFNEDLMVEMARAGGGNHYYGESAEDLMEPFEQEFELLANLCLRELRLSVAPAEGVAVEMLNELPESGGLWRLPDLAWGAEAWAVLRLRIDGRALPAPGAAMPLLRVTVSGRSLADEPVQVERAGLALPVLQRGAWTALPADALLLRRLAELGAARALALVRAAAGREDWDEADRLIAQAQQQFAGNPWVEAILAAIRAIADRRERDRLMKESFYTSSRLSLRLAEIDEGALRFSAADAPDTPAYLQRKPAQGKRLA